MATNGKLSNGDCVQVLGRTDNDTVDLVFADPPFNIGYDYDAYDDRLSYTDYLTWSSRWISEIKRVLKPSGTFWLAIGDEYAADLSVLCTRELGFQRMDWVIWYYTFGVHCKNKFARSHTHLFRFVLDSKRCTFNADAIRVPSARQSVYGDKRANPKGRVPDNTWILRPAGTFGPEDDTWHVPRVCGTHKERAGFHGCQMPERVMERIIRVSSRPGDLVCDPFAGSGTTLVVAKQLGRRWFGVELSADYTRRARDRIRDADPNALLA